MKFLYMKNKYFYAIFLTSLGPLRFVFRKCSVITEVSDVWGYLVVLRFGNPSFQRAFMYYIYIYILFTAWCFLPFVHVVFVGRVAQSV